MALDDGCPSVALPADGGTLVFWMIDRQSIWIDVAPDGTVTVNGEPVMRPDAVVRALRARGDAPARIADRVAGRRGNVIELRPLRRTLRTTSIA